MSDKDRIDYLVKTLNEARIAYEQEDREIMSNYEYDALYDELKALEESTGYVLSNSPTVNVGAEIVSNLPKEKHKSPMLSLDKTKDKDTLKGFLNDKEGLLSWKMDGLTNVLTYRNGELVKAVTRGNGEVGEVITGNAKVYRNVPLKIPFKGELVLRGEAIITYPEFERINAEITDTEAKYKNPRNLCSGTVRSLDNTVTKARNVDLYAFTLVSAEGMDFKTHSEEFEWLKEQGFTTVEYAKVNADNFDEVFASFKEKVTQNEFPSDGLVLCYNDIEYSKSLGRTSKFPKDALAFKWKDETVETRLTDVEWSVGRTGAITPVAVFTPVEIEGTTVSRASLHNMSIFKSFNLHKGDTIEVFKANMIIPQVLRNTSDNRDEDYTKVQIGNEIIAFDDDGETFTMKVTDIKEDGNHKSRTNPTGKVLYGIKTGSTKTVEVYEHNYLGLDAVQVPCNCPVCSEKVEIRKSDDVETLVCTNPECTAKKIRGFGLFVSRDAMNIDGVSESTIEQLINAGLLKHYADFYTLAQHRDKIEQLEGFGKRSTDKLLESIEKSKHVSMANFIYALGIPNIGLSTAKLICKHFGNDLEKIRTAAVPYYLEISGIGNTVAYSLFNYFNTESEIDELLKHIEFTDKGMVNVVSDNPINGKTFVITGSVTHFNNRNEVKDYIESLGGKVAGSVSKNTDYLINNDITSNSSKNKTAKSLGIPIISEDDFLKMAGDTASRPDYAIKTEDSPYYKTL